MTQPRALVVDDEPDAADMIKVLLEGDMSVDVCHSGAESLERVPRGNYDVVFTDLTMSGIDGLTLCRRLVENAPDLPVVVITGHASLESAVKALRVGAFDFLTKPVEPDLLTHAARRAVEHRRLRAEVKQLQERVTNMSASPFVAGSGPMRRVLDMVDRVAVTDATVLITGESGTGKELIARTLHERSSRRARPFVAVNCAAIPHHLIESELFGHAKGAFTDARNARTGLFQEADGGTLFLDEVGEMPLEMQAKLLRALQERVVRPVGSNAEVPYNARILAATNRDLETEIVERRFREDLYYRVAVVVIELPPLRDRAGDVPLMAQRFVLRFAERHGKRVVGISPPALQHLMHYNWPGNVRELENCIERAVALAAYDHLTPDDLPARVRAYVPEQFVIEGDRAEDLIPLADLERKYIQRVMNAVGGNKSKAARVLGIDRRTLYRMFEREQGAPSSPAPPESER
jgi:two-component system response regulator HydG